MTDVKEKYYPNGNIKSKEYWENGKLHREDGPAYISYDENGNIKYKKYFINHKLHREDGPAIISYYENGKIYKSYYLNGDRVTKEEWYSQLSTENKVRFTFGVDN